MYSKIKISLRYNTNFTPKYKNLPKFLKSNNKIFCKNFLFFFLIIDYMSTQNIEKKIKFNFFCLKLKKKN